jgi:hypothetical protein
MGAAGRERALTRFSWRAVAQATAEAYRQAVDEAAGSTPVAQENKGDEPTC